MKTHFLTLYYADTEVGAKLTLDAGGATNTLKQFKAELKSAQNEALAMADKFGPTSKAALEAAKRVAELRDRIQDANETAKLFDPGAKFQAVGNAVRGLVGGFTALQGAMALLGVEGEEVQKTLLKVQGALALTEGLNVVADITKDFGRLKSVLIQTLGKSGAIGLAIAGVGALTLAIYEWTRNTDKQTLAQQQLNDVNTTAIKNSIEEKVKLDLLVKSAQNTSLSVKDRLAKVKDLQKEFPGYFDNIKTERDLTDKLTAAYNSASDAIVKRAKATAAFDKIVENEKKILEIQSKTQAYIDDLNRVESRQAVRDQLLKFAKETSEGQIAEYRKANEELAKTINEGPPVKPEETKKAIEREVKKRVEKERQIRELTAGELERTKPIVDIADPDKFVTDELSDISAEEQAANKRVELITMVRDLSKSAADDIIAHQQAQAQAARETAETEEETARARIVAAQSTANALGALADLIGKQTAAGKALAIAQAIINTYTGVTEVLRAKSTLPEPAATIAKIANVAVIIATGLSAIKNIAKAQVPGSASGGGANIQTTAPLQPKPPQATQTLLNQQQLNQIGNATVRAFVLESDVSSNQERIRRTNRAARI